MTKYALILIGSLIAIWALGTMLTRSIEIDSLGPALSISAANKTAPEGLFIPNLRGAPLDAYLYLRRSHSVLLIKARAIELRTGDSVDGNLQFRLRFIGDSPPPKVEASEPGMHYDGFTTLRYNQLFDGVDLQLTEQSGIIGATFILEPGVDASRVMFGLENAQSNPIGDPSAYQIIDGQRVPVAASFEPARYGAMQLKLGKAAPAAAVHVDFEIAM